MPGRQADGQMGGAARAGPAAGQASSPCQGLWASSFLSATCLEVLEAKLRQQLLREVQHPQDLSLNLPRQAEDVGIVLRQRSQRGQ